jgi:ABC-type polysaccharide/polyol phosphate export permease
VVSATVAMLLAYALRFGPSEASHFLVEGLPVLAGVVSVQIVLAALARLYSLRGQVMWPVRLAFGAITGIVIVLFAAFSLGIERGVSQQAVASQGALFGLFGALWRSIVGLQVREHQRQAIREHFGHDNLVEQGAGLGSMTGGVSRMWEYRHLLMNIVTKDLKLKYQRSMLGFAWSLLNPLIMIAVYTLAFTYVMRLRTQRFVLFILIGLLAWNFFAGAVGSASESVVGNASLLRSVVFPRVVLPFSAVIFHLTQFLLTLVVFLPVMLGVYGVPPAPRMLLFPLFLLLQVFFTAGLTLLLATASTVFRDVKHLIEVGIGMFFWMTPIIYEPTMIPNAFQQVALLSPMSSYIRAYQDLFYYGVVPDLGVWIVASVYAAGMFVCGLSVFLAYEDRFLEFV